MRAVDPTIASGRVDSVLTRAYGRLGERYLLLFAVVGLLNATVAVILVVFSVLPVIWDSGKALECVAVGTLGSLISIVIIYTHFLRRFQPVRDWLSDRRRSELLAVAAWTSAVRDIEKMILFGIATFTLTFLPLPLYLRWRVGLPLRLVVFSPLIIGLAVAFAAALDFFAFGRLLRPVLRDIDRYLPADFDPGHRSISLGPRMLMVSTMVGVLAAYITASATVLAPSPVGRLIIGFGVGVAVMLTIGLAPGLFLADSVSTPLNELMDATRRVEGGDLSTRVPILGADETGQVARSFNRMMRGLEERAVLQSAMGSYVDPQVARRVLREGELLAGEELEATLMFVDIRDFTASCEHRSARETVSALNEFFALVVPCINSEGGVVNKFLGDGLLAVFGVPTTCEDHADRAVCAAGLIALAVEEHYGGGLRIGIGVNSGELVVGSIGGGGRLEFALIGDAVNIASRIESLTKERRDTVLVSEATRDALIVVPSGLVPRGEVEVRGRTLPLRIYALERPAWWGSPSSRHVTTSP